MPEHGERPAHPGAARAGTRASDPSLPLTSAERARMPLVDLIMREALDEEYVELARRRAGQRRPARPGVLAAVAVLLFGVLVTVSFQQTRSNEDIADAGREALAERIVARREVVSRAQDRIVELRASNTTLEAAADRLGDTSAQTALRLLGLKNTTGFAAAAGEGVRIVVGDAPDGLARHRVYDEDLALLVNGLWEAGASAVAVNGQRVTAQSAFRFSGSTIRINRVNLSSPYTVEALGDPRTLPADLLDTTTGLTFQSRASEFGFTLEMQDDVAQLSLPAAPDRLSDLRSATVAATPDSRPGGNTP